jgi:hypothetical protein
MPEIVQSPKQKPAGMYVTLHGRIVGRNFPAQVGKLIDFQTDVKDSTSQLQRCDLSMSDMELQNLTTHVSSATEDYRRAVEEGAPVNIVMERIWTLQDWLGRLVDVASDRPDDVAGLLESLRETVTDAVDIRFVERGPFPVNVPAVIRSRSAIRRSLAELELMNGGFVFAHATST